MARTFLRILDIVMVVVWAGGIVWVIVDEPTAPMPLIPVCGLYVAVRFVFPFLTGRGKRPDEIPPPAGRPMVETTCAGRIGVMRFKGPFMHVAVYDDRLVIRALWLEHTIMGHEIDDVTDGYSFGGVRIAHSAEATRSPIWLYTNNKVRDEIFLLRDANYEPYAWSEPEDQP